MTKSLLPLVAAMILICVGTENVSAQVTTYQYKSQTYNSGGWTVQQYQWKQTTTWQAPVYVPAPVVIQQNYYAPAYVPPVTGFYQSYQWTAPVYPQQSTIIVTPGVIKITTYP